MRAHQIMTKTVITTTEDASIVDVAKLRLSKHISGLPVIDAASRIIGIVSQGDFLRRVEIGTQRTRGRWLSLFAGPAGAAADFTHENGRNVGEIMTRDPVSILEMTSLEEIVRLMEEKNFNRLPVVRSEEVVGIVTRTNLLQAFAGLARSVPDPTADDDHIRDRIISTIEKASWAPFCLRVTVLQGVVDIGGTAPSVQSREAALVVAENTAGVIKVHDHFCWVDPESNTYVNFDRNEIPPRSH